jgi:hypothetical protein
MIAKERQTVGQLILDTNGEYARDNDQNKGFMDIFHEANLKNKTVLYTNRNIGTSFKKKYGEKSIKALKFDVFANIKPAFEIVEANLSTQKEAPIYLQPWLSSLMEEDESRFFADIWNPGLIFAIYYRCLYSAGLTPISEHHSYNGDLIVSKKFLGMIGVRHQVNNKNVKEDDAQTVFDELDEESKKEIISSLRIKKDGNTYICQHIPTMVEYASWYVDVVLKAKNSDGEASSIKGFAELMANPRRLYALK